MTSDSPSGVSLFMVPPTLFHKTIKHVLIDFLEIRSMAHIYQDCHQSSVRCPVPHRGPWDGVRGVMHSGCTSSPPAVALVPFLARIGCPDSWAGRPGCWSSHSVLSCGGMALCPSTLRTISGGRAPLGGERLGAVHVLPATFICRQRRVLHVSKVLSRIEFC